MYNKSFLIRLLPLLVFMPVLVMMSGCNNNAPELYLVDSEMTPSVSYDVATSEESLDDLSSQINTVFVHISGEVCVPGVYELNQGSRLFDAVSLAGGFTEDAAQDYCNLALILEDASKYYIPTVSEAQQLKEQELCTENQKLSHYDSEGRLNINLATKEELMGLSGIGASRADSIIAYRDEHGQFGSTEEIKNVSGIKEALYSQIAEYIVAL